MRWLNKAQQCNLRYGDGCLQYIPLSSRTSSFKIMKKLNKLCAQTLVIVALCSVDAAADQLLLKKTTTYASITTFTPITTIQDTIATAAPTSTSGAISINVTLGSSCDGSILGGVLGGALNNACPPSPPSSYYCAYPRNSNPSPWVSCKNGRLGYGTFNNGHDRIPDFSSAGYGGGGVSIPTVKAQTLLSPSGGDDAPIIQAALDAMGSLPLVNGFRGALLLIPGIYNIGSGIMISNSGIVLRGSGDGTILNVISNPSKYPSSTIITAEGTGNYAIGKTVAITDNYVPVHGVSFNVSSTTGFSVGDSVVIERPVSSSWIKFMGMDNLVRNGQKQAGWGDGSGVTRYDRVITGIQHNTITLDAPLTDALNSSFGTCNLRRYTWSTRLNNVGVENLRALAPNLGGKITTPQYVFASFDKLQNSWMRNVATLDMNNGFVKVKSNAKWVTIQNVNISHSSALDHSDGYPSDLQSIGTQVLYDNVFDHGSDIFYAVTQAWSNGPNVFRNMHTTAPNTGSNNIAPHQRWATGVLFENVTIQNGGLQIANRGNYGSGQGWSAGYSVVWNTQASNFTIQNPPGGFNMCIGCKGENTTPDPIGVFSKLNQRVWPESLYLEQLSARLGRRVTSV